MRIGRSFLILLFATILPAPMIAEEPFRFESTPGKLPKQIVPIDYAIRIIPNLDKRTFTGTERVTLNVREPVREIVLNALEIDVASASVDANTMLKAAIKVDNQNELLRIALPSEVA